MKSSVELNEMITVHTTVTNITVLVLIHIIHNTVLLACNLCNNGSNYF